MVRAREEALWDQTSSVVAALFTVYSEDTIFDPRGFHPHYERIDGQQEGTSAALQELTPDEIPQATVFSLLKSTFVDQGP